MLRRSNKSHKVPNVKLRPAQGSYPNLNGLSQHWAEDSQVGSDDARFQDNCPRPFKGVVVCATGVPDKTTLFKQALELGATSVPALTDRVTHLIAMESGSAKYHCALLRKIPILSPSWIHDSYRLWLRGDDVDLEESVQQYRLPIFTGVVLCFSGIADSARRAEIIKLVNENGGTFMKLERPVRITHLLCSGDEKTDKMRMAEKFNSRGEAEIRLVWEEWFWDSLEYGGRFPEETYFTNNPRPERKPVEALPSQVADSGPSRSASIQVEPPPPPATKPVNLDLEDLEDEAASIAIVPAVRLQVWGGLLERRGYEVTDGEVLRSPTKSQSGAASDSHAKSSKSRPSAAAMRRAGSVIAAVRSTNSFAPAEPEAGPSTAQRPLPFKRTATSRSALSRAATPLNNPSLQPSRQPSVQGQPQPEKNAAGPSSIPGQEGNSPPMPQIFSGYRICPLGEARIPAVRGAIEESGGIYVQEEDDGAVDFFIVRLLSGSKIYRSEPDPLLREKYRTECWLERCIHDERICQPSEHVSFSPLGINIPVPGAEKIEIGLSGLDQSESCHVRRLLRAFGISLVPLFSRKATHLLCPSGTGLKFQKAGEWGIPVVSNGWLEAIATLGVIPPVEKYLITGPIAPAQETVAPPADVKGKGKAVDHGDLQPNRSGVLDGDVRMQDITNSTPPDIQESPRHQATQLPPEKAHPAPISKHNSLERQGTTILSAESQAAPKGFGQPTEILGGSAMSSFFGDPLSVQSLSPVEPLVRFGTRTSSSVAYTVDGSFNAHRAQAKEPEQLGNEGRAFSRKSSAMSLASHATTSNDDRDIRIPSSKSPSPMKILGRRTSSLSPVKLDPNQAKALQESIASLLGKRQSPSDDAIGEDGNNEMNDVEQTNDTSKGGRNAKRKKPPRPKPSTRPRAQRSRTAASTRKSPPPPTPADAASLSAFEVAGHGADEESQLLEEQQSARVIYEDPGQAEERDRLLSMLKVAAEMEGSLPSGSIGRTRRSARVAGMQ